MKREIKFRGREEDTREWYYGYYIGHVELDDKYGLITWYAGTDMYTIVYVDPETVGQYTGLKDNNGVEIYEGDVVECKSKSPFSLGRIIHHNIIWGTCCWWAEGTFFNLAEYLDYGPCEVMGNIHDNPELTK